MQVLSIHCSSQAAEAARVQLPDLIHAAGLAAGHVKARQRQMRKAQRVAPWQAYHLPTGSHRPTKSAIPGCASVKKPKASNSVKH